MRRNCNWNKSEQNAKRTQHWKSTLCGVTISGHAAHTIMHTQPQIPQAEGSARSLDANLGVSGASSRCSLHQRTLLAVYSVLPTAVRMTTCHSCGFITCSVYVCSQCNGRQLPSVFNPSHSTTLTCSLKNKHGNPAVYVVRVRWCVPFRVMKTCLVCWETP